ncbi:MAG: hypothetical protein CM1200mP2_19530 [Planctomycetaceae bacterium]|nr:MAG: hypothetical protein CM1200mP2_19530 [Planctomycetaceae bacterium]
MACGVGGRPVRSKVSRESVQPLSSRRWSEPTGPFGSGERIDGMSGIIGGHRLADGAIGPEVGGLVLPVGPVLGLAATGPDCLTVNRIVGREFGSGAQEPGEHNLQSVVFHSGGPGWGKRKLF